MSNPATDPRKEAIWRWIAPFVPTAQTMEPASADASFRRYFRVTDAAGASFIVMDAPPNKEDSAPFVRIAQLHAQAGVHAPKIIASDLEQGFLLLSDLGRDTYLDVFPQQSLEQNAASLALARNALVNWQLASAPDVLPPYDRALLQRELDLFPDWYVRMHLKRTLTPQQNTKWRQMCELLIERALAQPSVYVHRDFMPRNLMVPQSPDGAPGVLDFQDATYGPISYDIISLYRDAFWSWDEEFVLDGVIRYWEAAKKAGLPVNTSFGDFYHDCDWMGLQRHLKIMGIFARIHYRDGKPKYLADTPRFEKYVRDVAARYSALTPLLELFDALHDTQRADVGYTF
jgi:N-acetylmuramate 1-kinase